jgi:hypothetical protein
MWLFTPIGFFSAVQKSNTNFLTIRARVESDLDALRITYLPSLSPTIRTKSADYPYRATVGHAEFSIALSNIAKDIKYSNFKDEVARRQGYARANIYNNVWLGLLDLEGGFNRKTQVSEEEKPQKKPANIDNLSSIKIESVNSPLLKSLEEEIVSRDRILGSCTSRFNGFAYRVAEYESRKLIFDYSQIVNNFEIFPLDIDNWLAYFLLNREMHWSSGQGGEFSLTSPQRIAINFLFLHIYRLEPPLAYSNPNSSWYSLEQTQIEEYASLVRRYMVQMKFGK